MSRLEDPAPQLRWTGHSDLSGRNTAWTTAALPGIVVRHCGHLNVPRPYFVEGTPKNLGLFARLRQAQVAAEAASDLAPPAQLRPMLAWFVTYRHARGQLVTFEVEGIDVFAALHAADLVASRRAGKGASDMLEFMRYERRPPDALTLCGTRIDGDAQVHIGPAVGGAVLLPAPWDVVRQLPLRLDLVNHSPTGFEWGYGGSGPAQLALAAAALVVGDANGQAVHQTLKLKYFAALSGDTWQITVGELRHLIAAFQPTCF